MILQDAVKSNKRFKRKNQTMWYDLTEDKATEFFSKQDLLATDWEVEETTITMTLSQFTTLYDKLITVNGVSQSFVNAEDLKKKLIAAMQF